MHEFERNVGAFDPICPLRRANFYLLVQLLNQLEFMMREWIPNDRLQIYVASFKHEISIGQRARQVQPDDLFAEYAFQSVCPIGQDGVNRGICSEVVHSPTPPYDVIG